jgi:hypothetical protein
LEYRDPAVECVQFHGELNTGKSFAGVKEIFRGEKFQAAGAVHPAKRVRQGHHAACVLSGRKKISN